MPPQPQSILIVDDDEDIREFLALFVRGLGILAVEASQGESAVDMMDHGYVPTLIISDIIMPTMDGKSFLKIIRDRYPEIPFIIVTGAWTQELAEQATSLGVLEIFEKPCDMAQLERVIRKLL